MSKFISITILLATLRIATPLILGALGGVFSEKSGVVNIALEGIMLMGAFASVVATYYTKNPWIGVIFAMLVGAVFAAIHAVVSIKYKANQVVSGTAINMLAGGVTIFMLRLLFNVEGTSPSVAKLPQWYIPGTEYSFNPIVYFALILVVVSWVVLYKTPLGLRIRTVGEHPAAADTVGINVYRVRYLAVIISGVLAGLAGAHLAIGEGTVFVRNMTAGRGFIALAAMIIGNWHPIGALGAALLFGYSEAVQITLSGITIAGAKVPSQFIEMIPYVVTIIVLAGFIGKTVPPKASGVAYEKGER